MKSHTNTWERFPDVYDDPEPDDDVESLPVRSSRDSLTDAQLQRRLQEALGLLRAVRQQEREAK